MTDTVSLIVTHLLVYRGNTSGMSALNEMTNEGDVISIGAKNFAFGAKNFTSALILSAPVVLFGPLACTTDDATEATSDAVGVDGASGNDTDFDMDAPAESDLDTDTSAGTALLVPAAGLTVAAGSIWPSPTLATTP